MTRQQPVLLVTLARTLYLVLRAAPTAMQGAITLLQASISATIVMWEPHLRRELPHALRVHLVSTLKYQERIAPTAQRAQKHSAQVSRSAPSVLLALFPTIRARIVKRALREHILILEQCHAALVLLGSILTSSMVRAIIALQASTATCLVSHAPAALHPSIHSQELPSALGVHQEQIRFRAQNRARVLSHAALASG